MNRLDDVATITALPTSWTVDAAQARLLAVDVDLDGRVVERLLELDVAEEGDALHLGGDLLRRAAGRCPGRCR